MNCFQILYIRSLNTIFLRLSGIPFQLWIAFRFCIFVLWTQWMAAICSLRCCCELLSDFVYSFFEHNIRAQRLCRAYVVNCFQILYIRSLNTIRMVIGEVHICCELLSDFVYSFFEHNCLWRWRWSGCVVNCFQILYIRSLNTICQLLYRVYR